jgi:putative FmdB family regulatory protein
MPLYDFLCHACGTEFEARAPIGQLAPCASCGSTDVKRVLSGFAGPFTVAPRGAAAKRSDDSRRVREQQRQERTRARQHRQDSG